MKKGDRIAQLVLERIMTPEVMETEVADHMTDHVISCDISFSSDPQELPESERGGGGFGSTGL